MNNKTITYLAWIAMGFAAFLNGYAARSLVNGLPKTILISICVLVIFYVGIVFGRMQNPLRISITVNGVNTDSPTISVTDINGKTSSLTLDKVTNED